VAVLSAVADSFIQRLQRIKNRFELPDDLNKATTSNSLIFSTSQIGGDDERETGVDCFESLPSNTISSYPEPGDHSVSIEDIVAALDEQILVTVAGGTR